MNIYFLSITFVLLNILSGINPVSESENNLPTKTEWFHIYFVQFASNRKQKNSLRNGDSSF